MPIIRNPTIGGVSVGGLGTLAPTGGANVLTVTSDGAGIVLGRYGINAAASAGVIISNGADGYLLTDSSHVQHFDGGAVDVGSIYGALFTMYGGGATTKYIALGNGSVVGPKLWGGSGVPSNSMGADGDYCFRTDGTAAAHTLIYHKESGSWVATGA